VYQYIRHILYAYCTTLYTLNYKTVFCKNFNPCLFDAILAAAFFLILYAYVKLAWKLLFELIYYMEADKLP